MAMTANTNINVDVRCSSSYNLLNLSSKKLY